LERVTGTFFSFLSNASATAGDDQRINLDEQTLGTSDATGYTRFALGPPRPARAEGRGWLYAAGELAMTAHDLAVWDISLIEHKLLKPASLDVMTTPVRLRKRHAHELRPGSGGVGRRRHPKLAHGGRSVPDS